MAQAEYLAQGEPYQGACDPAGMPARVALFADRDLARAEILQDLSAAGFRTFDGGDVKTLLDGPIALLGDVVMVDCPVVDARTMAALARLDMRVSRSGARLVVATSMEALDDVFAALDQSGPQILVEPSRAERVVAVGRVLAEVSGAKVREMSDDDRVALLRLSQQVDAIAHQLDRIGLCAGREERPEQSDLNAPALDLRAPAAVTPAGTPVDIRAARSPLPEPRVVRRMIAGRQARAKFFDADLFADPAWDMLLDLTAAHAEHQRVSVTSLCIASGVPATTALRWIKQLVDSGVFERISDPSDGRRAFIALSERSQEAMARYFAEVEVPLAQAA